MAHLSTSVKPSEASTPKEWLKIGAQMGDLCNGWARRGDIIAYVGPTAGSGAPACYKPAIAEMEVNTTLAFGDTAKPEYIGDFNDRMTQFDYPVAAGAILHEAMHARHSKWPLIEMTKHKDRREARLVELFEETRIEMRGVEHYPRNRSFLRACALKLVIGDLKPAEILANGVLGLSQLMLLSLARVDAGVLEPEDVELVQEKAEEYFGKKVVKKLRKIWMRAQDHRKDTEWAPLLECAKDWIKLLEDEGHDTKAGSDPGLEAILVAIIGEMPEMAEDAETEARSEGTVQVVIEMSEAEAEAAAEQEKELGEAKRAAAIVFDKTTGYVGTRGSGSRMVKEREPEPDERKAAILLARELEKARYRDRIQVNRSTVLPPGRLQGRAAVQAAADRVAGRNPTAAPWSSTRRYHTEDPNLTVGVMVDISGSMGAAMNPMATTAWVMSEAVRRVQGKVAMVYYGSGVFPTLRPGEHLEKVRIYTAPDGTERFDEAFQALNGGLQLLGGQGARLLVIVSDFCYTPDQTTAAHKWLARCKQDGVAVICLPFGNSSYAEAMAENTSNDMRVLTTVMDPAAAALTIGHEAATALTAQGSR
jgi:hypothetical protein